MEIKRLCPNCGKELTLSVRKCKYCNTHLTTDKTKVKNIVTSIITILIIALILSLVYLGISHVNWSLIYSWLKNMFELIGCVVIVSTLVYIFVFAFKDSIENCKKENKETKNQSLDTEEQELMKKLLQTSNANKNIQRNDVNIVSVNIKNGAAYIYDKNGIEIGKTPVQEGSVLTSCGGKYFTIKNKSYIETYEYRGELFGFILSSKRSI